MGMVVRTNTMALNAYRQLGMNNSAVSKSLEKLASGYRINRAGDDAAGLAISEKMKAQITGLETASANAQDGISLIQTAEGNLGEVHDMLNRMVELATKSANGTYTQTERNALQDEVDALLEEIDRISQSANFNGTNLLDGTMGLNKEAFAIGASVSGADPAAVSLTGFATKVTAGDATYHEGSASVSFSAASFEVDLGQLEFTSAVTNGTLDVGLAGVTLSLAATEITGAMSASALASALAAKTTQVTIGAQTFDVTASGNKLSFTMDTAVTTLTTAQAAAVNSAIGSGVTVTAAAGGSGEVKGNGAGEIPHNTINVQQAVADVAGTRAGIDFDLSADSIVKDGYKLTIDDKTFVFKTDANSSVEAGDGETLIDVSAYATDSEKVHAAVDLLSNESTTNFKIESKNGTTIHIDQKADSTNVYDSEDKLHKVFSATDAGAAEGIELTVTADKINSGDAIRVGDKTYKFGTGTDSNTVKYLDKDDAVNALKTALENDGYNVDLSGSKLTIHGTVGADAPAITGGGLTLQIGDTADDFNKMTVAVDNMSTKGLGLDGLKITSETLSSDAIAKVKTAINSVSTTRAGMGALQNRLEHTINNLDVAAENLSAADSRIRDTDMAKEMMNYTKMNVLVQSAQAMLAQANQQPQSVLQLLQ